MFVNEDSIIIIMFKKIMLLTTKGKYLNFYVN
jgi:hypothetical protein